VRFSISSHIQADVDCLPISACGDISAYFSVITSGMVGVSVGVGVGVGVGTGVGASAAQAGRSSAANTKARQILHTRVNKFFFMSKNLSFYILVRWIFNLITSSLTSLSLEYSTWDFCTAGNI